MQDTDIAHNKKTIPNDIIIPQIKELLDQGHSVTLKLYGHSMRPFLENGRDKAVLKKLAHVKKHDVVLAETSPKHYVLHRVVAINGNNITLRGDGNIATESCNTNDIYGTATCFYRKGSDTPCHTSSLKWIAYSTTWCWLLPIRRYLLYAYRLLHRKPSIADKQR